MSLRSRATWAHGLALVLGAASTRADAQNDSDARGRWLQWRAPPACPDLASGLAAIAALRGDREPRSNARARVTIKPAATGRWTAEVVVRDPTGASSRRVDGASCARVADAAALVVAIAFDALVESERGPGPAPPTAANAAASSNATQNDAAAMPAAEARAPRTPHPSLAVSVVSDLGSFPGLAVGASVALGLELNSTTLGLEATAWIPRFAPSSGDEGVSISRLSGALRGCYALLAASPLELAPCLAVELGRVNGEPHHLLDPAPQRSLWVAALAGVRARYRTPSGFGAWLGLELELPLLRPRYVIADFGSAFQAAPVGGRGAFGLLWDFD